MFSKIINNIYPYISLGIIQLGTLVENSTNVLNLFIFLLQGLIGLLTVLKLWKDIKSKKFKSIDIVQKETEKKYVFITQLFK